MIDLNEHPKFKADALSNHVTIYPIMIINKPSSYEDNQVFLNNPRAWGGTNSSNSIHISTVQEVILSSNSESAVPIPFDDLNLKVSNIRESLSYKDRRFKVSNVNVTLNNYLRNKEIPKISNNAVPSPITSYRLSDFLAEQVNKEVEIYYKTQSCKSLEDCVLIYKGVLADVKGTTESLSLVLEDSSYKILENQVPLANIGFNQNVYSKSYKNRYIPMCYGKVDKAPAVLYKVNDIVSGVHVITDAVEDIVGDGRNIRINSFESVDLDPVLNKINPNNEDSSPLYIYKDGYCNVRYEVFDLNSQYYGYPKKEQFIIDGDSIFIEKMFILDFPQNPPADNVFQCARVVFPDEAKLLLPEKVGEVVNEEVDSEGNKIALVETTIKSAEAIIDNNDRSSDFILESADWFITKAQIPNPDYIIPEIEDDGYIPLESFEFNSYPFDGSVVYPRQEAVHDDISLSNNIYFKSLDPTGSFEENQYIGQYTDIINQACPFSYGIGYDSTGNINAQTTWSYTGLIRNWLKCHADLYPCYAIQIKPTEIRFRMEQWLFENGYNDLQGVEFDDTYHLFDFSGLGAIYGNQLTWGGAGFQNLTGTIEPEVIGYSPAQTAFREQNKYSAAGIDYMPEELNDRNDWEKFWFDFCLQFHEDAETKGLAACTFPAYFFKFKLDTDAWHSVGLEEIVIGQRSAVARDLNPGNASVEEAMFGGEGEGYTSELDDNGNLITKRIFVNLLDEGNGDPYLFKLEDIPHWKIEDRIFASYPDEENDYYNWVMNVSYSVKWNGIEFDNTMDTQTSFSGALAESLPSEFMGDNMYWTDPALSYGNTYHYSTLGNTKANSLRYGTFLYFPSGVPSGGMMRESDVEGAYASNSYMGLLPHTFFHTKFEAGEVAIALETMGDLFNLGEPIPAAENVTEQVTLNSPSAVGSTGNIPLIGNSLMMTFPFSNLSLKDAVDCRTYAFGRLKVEFNPTGEISSDTNSKNYFNLFLSATDIPEDPSGLAVEDISFAIEEDFTVNLFQGEDNVFFHGIQGGDGTVLNSNEFVTWDSFMTSTNDTYVDGNWQSIYQINEWREPDSFNGVSLTYRLDTINSSGDYDSGGEDKKITFDTEIVSLGIMQFIMIENIFEDNFYIDTFGRTNPTDETVLENGVEVLKYTGQSLASGESLIDTPADVLYHIVEKELGAIDIVNREDWMNAKSSLMKLAFSITEKTESKKLIQDIVKSTKLITTFKRDNTLSFMEIKDYYSEGSSIIIKAADCMNPKISMTPTKDIYTLVNVKYKKDYETGEYTKETGYCDGYDFFGNGDGISNFDFFDEQSELLGVEFPYYETLISTGYSYKYYNINREDNILEFESDYIRDYSSAVSLRDFLYLNYCNRHTILDIELPLGYSYLEVGDIVSFDGVVKNLKNFGESYTLETKRNGQIITTCFMVTKTSKTSKTIKISCTQLHGLRDTVSTDITKGSLTRLSITNAAGFQYGGLNLEDWNILNKYINGEYPYMTSKQKELADFGYSDSIINDRDLLALQIAVGLLAEVEDGEWSPTGDELIGDMNQDGQFNVQDIVALVNVILNVDTVDYDELILYLADMNQDGIVNVIDIVSLVSEVLGN